ncbi:MAG: hypothetical protein JOY78_19740 [Pseudonocardia sp.]|nr:hypothetical protein [Pseudonocardia sp.]
MGFVLGFRPWIPYWALIGNVPLRLVAVLVLAVATAVQVIERLRRRPCRSLEVGSLAVFGLLTIAAFATAMRGSQAPGTSFGSGRCPPTPGGRVASRSAAAARLKRSPQRAAITEVTRFLRGRNGARLADGAPAMTGVTPS